MLRSLQARLLIPVGVLAVAAVAAAAIAARQTTRQEFRRFQELVKVTDQRGRLLVPADAVARALTGRCCAADAIRAAERVLQPAHAFVVVEAGSSRPLAMGGTARTALGDVHVEAERDRLIVSGIRTRGATSESVKLIVPAGGGSEIEVPGGRRAVVHVLPLPELGLEDSAAVFLGSIDRRLVMATALIAALVLLTTWAITRRIVGPVRELRDAARHLAAGDLSRRVVASGSDEIAQLASAFNAMAGELERQQTARRNLVHNVTHELRTPLTSLRCQLESAIDGVTKDPVAALQSANEEVSHLSRLVDDLQELALAEAGELQLALRHTRLLPVVRSALRAAGLEADARISVDVDEGLHVYADSVRLRQILLNLLTNAGRHTPTDGRIVVAARRDPAEVRVAVHNTGSTLNDQELARVFDRFWRADPSRQRATGGSGLGLAIVKHLVEAQGGRVTVQREANGITFSAAYPAVRGTADVQSGAAVAEDDAICDSGLH